LSIPPTRWLARRLGRRGACLIVLGLAFIGVGINALLSGPPDTHHVGRYLLHNYLPFWVEALLWAGAGLAAVHASGKHGTGRDGYGFAALIVPLALRIVSYLGSFLAYLVGLSGWGGGGVSAVVWTGLMALILIIAGWPEVEVPRRRRRDRTGGTE
jgi:MFS family permease